MKVRSTDLQKEIFAGVLLLTLELIINEVYILVTVVYSFLCNQGPFNATDRLYYLMIASGEYVC